MSRYEKKMKDKLDDEMKLAGLESLVPEELVKHLILNSTCLRTFEDARLEVVTYVEAKFGLRISASKPSDTGARGHSDSMDVDAVNSLVWQRQKGHRVRVMGVLSAMEHIFTETAMHAKAQVNNRMAKANRASHGPRVSPHSQEKARVKKIMEKTKGTKSSNQGVKSSHKGKTSKTGLSCLENSKSGTSSETQESGQTCPTDTSWNEGWNGDEWNDG